MATVRALLTVALLYTSAVAEFLPLAIIHPPSGSHQGNPNQQITISRLPPAQPPSTPPPSRNDGPASDSYNAVCVNLTRILETKQRSESYDHSVHGCYRWKGHRQATNVAIELTVYATYFVSAWLLNDQTGERSAAAATNFSYGVSDACAARLRGAAGRLSTSYNKHGFDPWHTHHLSPLCLEDAPVVPPPELGELLTSNSGFRGAFGVDHTLMEFGHGDQMFLHFLLSRHREEIEGDFVEIGTFAGVTSLVYGLSAALRGRRFHSFDIEDLRPPHVKATWLPNMAMRFWDTRTPPTQELVAALRGASVVMVDAEGAPRLQQAMVLGPLLRGGATTFVLVHDFPCGTSEEDWSRGMRSAGFRRIHHDTTPALAEALRTSIGVFVSDASTGSLQQKHEL
jgi:hypothetical protein